MARTGETNVAKILGKRKLEKIRRDMEKAAKGTGPAARRAQRFLEKFPKQ